LLADQGLGVVPIPPAYLAYVATTAAVTFNPSDKAANITLSSGNRLATKATNDALASVRATRGIANTDSGYFEVRIVNYSPDSAYQFVGIATSSLSLTASVGSDANSWGYYMETGQKYTGGSYSSYGASYTENQTIGCAFKNGKVWFSKNGVWQNSGDPAADTGAAFTGITGTLYPAATLYRSSGGNGADQVQIRTHASQCDYAAPSGFKYWEY
jgi:hypothetical protein